MDGGGAASLNEFSWVSNGKRQSPKMASKVTGVKLKQGDSVRLATPGGGGYGDALKRDKAKIKRDVKNGYISKKRAALYGGIS
jgi:N-methylhydantoinase B